LGTAPRPSRWFWFGLLIIFVDDRKERKKLVDKVKSRGEVVTIKRLKSWH